MENDELFDALFALMQDIHDISANIEDVVTILFNANNVKVNFIDKVTEKFYNLMLIFLRDTHDSLWYSEEHRINVMDNIKEKLDEFTEKPTLDIKNKFYA